MSILNKKNYNTFRSRCRGADILEIHVKEKRGPGKVRLQYNARDPRSGALFQGEWTIDARNREKGEVEGDVETFYDLAQQTFAVTVHKADGDVVKLGEEEE